MSVRTGAFAASSSVPTRLDFTGETVSLTLTTAASTIAVGDVNVTTADGLLLKTGTINLGKVTGALFVIGAAGSEAISWLAAS